MIKTCYFRHFLVLVSSIFIFTLTSQLHGQSKKKAIEWINTNGISLSKIENSSSVSFSILKVDKDSIYFFNNYLEESRQSVRLKDILYEDIATLERKSNFDNYRITNFVMKVKTFKRNAKNKKVAVITDLYFPFEDESKASRVVKAIMDLAQLSGAKENKQIY